MEQAQLKQFLKLLRKIPKGRATSYKLIGKAAGVGPRQAGYYLSCNEWPELYPCYKVVKSDGQLGGFSGAGGTKTKKKLLERDGIKISKGKIVDWEKVRYAFK